MKWLFSFGFILAIISVFGVFMTCGSGEDDSDAAGALTLTDDDGGDDDTQDWIDGVPDEVNDFLDSDDLAALEDAGMPIHYGDAPPDIEGNYELNSLYIVYDTSGPNGPKDDYDFTFWDQSDDGSIKLSYDAVSIADSKYNISAYISGSDSCFTVFADIHGQDGSCTYSSPFLFSGCRVSSGLRHFYWSMIITSAEGSDCTRVLPAGTIRIIHETDDLATQIYY